jgi:hypothetical protein
MIKSVAQLKYVQMPFAVDNILTARVDLPRTSYPDSAASIRFFEQLLPKLQGWRASPPRRSRTVCPRRQWQHCRDDRGKAYPQKATIRSRVKGS